MEADSGPGAAAGYARKPGSSRLLSAAAKNPTLSALLALLRGLPSPKKYAVMCMLLISVLQVRVWGGCALGMVAALARLSISLSEPIVFSTYTIDTQSTFTRDQHPAGTMMSSL